MLVPVFRYPYRYNCTSSATVSFSCLEWAPKRGVPSGRAMHVRISTESTQQLPLPNTAAFLLTALATTHAADRVASPSRGQSAQPPCESRLQPLNYSISILQTHTNAELPRGLSCGRANVSVLLDSVLVLAVSSITSYSPWAFIP